MTTPETPTDQAPSATDSAPSRVHCALCEAPLDGFGCPVQCRVLGEVQPGRVYAIGVPRGISEATLHAHLRMLAERTKAEVVAFVEPLSLVELESGVLADARAARDAADARAARTWDQREAYRHQAAELAAELATLRRPTTAVVREVDGRLVVDWPDGRGNTIATPEVVEGWADQINTLRTQRAELDRVHAAPTARWHADGSLSVDWPEGATSCLMSREVLDGVLLERATLRSEVDERRAKSDEDSREVERLAEEADRLGDLLREMLHLADNGFMAPEVRREEIARIRREAGLA